MQMNRDETKKILAILEMAYPNFYKNADDEGKANAIALWQDMFSDVPAANVGLAVKASIATCKFPPTISEIKDYIQRLTEPDQMSGERAWQYVRDALSFSAHFRDDIKCTEFGYDYSDYFNKLPPAVQSVIGTWQQIRLWGSVDETDLEQFERPRFVKGFEARQKATAEFNRLPGSIRDQSAQIKGVGIDKLLRIAESKARGEGNG